MICSSGIVVNVGGTMQMPGRRGNGAGGQTGQQFSGQQNTQPSQPAAGNDGKGGRGAAQPQPDPQAPPQGNYPPADFDDDILF